MLTEAEGQTVVKFARASIESFLTGKNCFKPAEEAQENELCLGQEQTFNFSPIFNEKHGVFVTLTENGLLRGCIGHPYPDSALKDAIFDSAISAASRDPRFPPVEKAEMKKIIVEVTVLTSPEKIEAPPEKLPELIKIGRHGLLVRRGYYQGLLLPQVAPENGFDAVDFLNQTCMKAGLPADAWLKGAEVYWFEGQIYKEREPMGEIFEERL